jgi:nickel/cobalt exporter
MLPPPAGGSVAARQTGSETLSDSDDLAIVAARAARRRRARAIMPVLPALQRCAMRLLALAIALFAVAGAASAHPHVFVEARSEIVFDDAGRIAAVRQVWRFDEGFSAFASQGLDADRDGVLSQGELAPLAQVNIESLKEYHYFTFVDVAGKQVGIADPKEYWLTHDDGRLTLFFTVPLAEPIATDGRTVRVDVYDPEYYVAIDLVPDKPFALAGAVPAACKLTVKLPEDLDPQTATMLAVIPPDTRNLPENLRSVTQALANSALIDCPAAAAPPSAGDAGTPMPRFGAVGPFGVGAPEATGGTPTGIFAVIAEWQRAFYERLTDTVKRMKDDRWAAVTLIALAFAYGVFHAAGPGHGKAVIAAYLVANEATARRAIALSFLSAMLQAVVAIAIVGIAAAILNLTSFAITSTARVAEIASAGLVALLGAVLVVRKVLQPAAVAVAARLQRPRHALAGAAGTAGPPPGRGAAASRFVCDEVDPTHVHGPSCGHVVAPARLVGAGFAATAIAVVSAGARPCTGALIALVFALSQGMFAAGVVATVAMAIGTGLTVAALGLMAVGAKGLASRLSAAGSGHAAAAIGVLEGVASLGVLALGLTLLLAALAMPG